MLGNFSTIGLRRAMTAATSFSARAVKDDLHVNKISGLFFRFRKRRDQGGPYPVSTWSRSQIPRSGREDSIWTRVARIG
jgi:hypothetical protein